MVLSLRNEVLREIYIDDLELIREQNIVMYLVLYEIRFQ